jgi:hypothetical protein
MSEIRDRPVFICGHPKAGTTLLRNLLDSHPQLIVYPEETLFFRNYLRKADSLDAEGLLALAKSDLINMFYPQTAQQPDQDYSDIPFDVLVDRLTACVSQAEIRHPGDLLSAVVLAFGEVLGLDTDQACRWVEKTPYNEQFASRIFSWWPEARCIHIVRDPCDNFASYERKHEEWRPGFFSANWNRSTAAGFKNMEIYGPEKYLLMPYEDLVTQPEEKLTEICAFLGIEDHPILRQPTKRGQLWRGNSMFDDRFSTISSAAVGRWQTVLDPYEAALIQLITRKYRQALGYSQESSKPVRAVIEAAYWRVRPILYDLVKGQKKDW